MQIAKHPLTIVVQTVRLPHGRDQFVVPSGCLIDRKQLLTELDRSHVDASHKVVQPETGREGIERLVVLGTQQLNKPQKVELIEWLQCRLKSVPDIINDVTHHPTDGDLPASTVLARWQDEMRALFPSSTIGKTGSGTYLSKQWILVVMLGLGLLSVVTLWVMVPQLSDFFPNKGSVKNDVSSNDIPSLISKKWNLTKDKEFAGEDHLLKIVDPLVAPTQNKSNRERLVYVLLSVNQLRLGDIGDKKMLPPNQMKNRCGHCSAMVL